LKGAVIHRFCETFLAGEDPVTRLTASFNEVLAQRQAELAGRTFEINRAEAVRALLPLAQNYLQSGVFRRVSEISAQANHATSAPLASPGLWSELRFRLRRQLGILTGTIDKLLIYPAADTEAVDIEIIDFKTNRFAIAPVAAKTRRAAAVVSASQKTPASTQQPGQASFDFERIAEVVEEAPAVPLREQIRAVASDYQLQMQAYALALRELLSASDSPHPLRLNSLRATLHFLDPNEEFNLPAALLEPAVCAKAIDNAMEEIAVLDATLEAERFPPDAAAHCRMCNFRDLCPAGREWLRGN
jgi:hypothetical protein